MPIVENKDLARRLFEEGFSQGKVDVVDEVLDSNFVCYDPNSESGEVRGADTIKGEIEYFRNAVPDLTYTIEDQIAEDDKVVTRYTVSGIHQGEFFGVAPTGKRIRMTGMSIDRFEGGKMVEEWVALRCVGGTRRIEPETFHKREKEKLKWILMRDS